MGKEAGMPSNRIAIREFVTDDELMALCDLLESRLAAAREAQAAFAAAAAHHLEV